MPAHANLYSENVQTKRTHAFGYWDARGLGPCSLKLENKIDVSCGGDSMNVNFMKVENSPSVSDIQFLYKTLLKTRRIASIVRAFLESFCVCLLFVSSHPDGDQGDRCWWSLTSLVEVLGRDQTTGGLDNHSR